MNMRFVKIISKCLILLFLLSSFTACSFHTGIRIASKYSSSKKHMSGSFAKLSGEDFKEINLNEGDVLRFTYEIKIESGNLEIFLNDPEGEEIIEFLNGQKYRMEINIESSGTYKIVVIGDEAKGSYDIKWETN